MVDAQYSLINFDPPGAATPDKHLFPRNTRVLLAGSSGSGKTNCFLNIISRGWLAPFDRLMVFSKSMHQDKYRRLIDHFSTDGKLDESVVFTDDDDRIPDLSNFEYERVERKVSKKGKVTEKTVPIYTLLVFDDYLCASKAVLQRITDLFIRSRHFNCTCFFLSQSFFRTPKTLRLQCDQLVIFCPISTRESNLIFQECSADIDLRTFQRMLKVVNDEPYQFLFIDKYARKVWLRYRLCFDRTFKELVPARAIKNPT